MKMNKFYSAISHLMVMAFAVVFITSCEPFDYYPYGHGGGSSGQMDYDQSKAFSGQWTGDFCMFYEYAYAGRILRFDSYDTDVVFYPEYNGARYGWGKQVDFYEAGPYEYIYHKFNWEIRDGIVYLSYLAEPSLNCWIRDYHMTNDVFYGYFGNSDDSFRLRKIADYYNWTPYVNTYSYGERRDWYSGYYAAKAKNDKLEAADSLTLSTSNADTVQTGIISFGRRTSEDK